MITSKNNEIIKNAVKLKDKKFREIENKFLIEGEKILNECLSEKYKIDCIFYLNNLSGLYDDIEKIQVNDTIMKLLTTTSSPSPCVAIVNKKVDLKDEVGNFLVLDRIQDPSNVGAIIRSALGADFTKIYLIDCADIFDTKTIRSSMGAIFHTKCIKCTENEILNLDYPLLALSMEGKDIFETDFKDMPCGLIIGNEGKGISDNLRKKAVNILSIPMNNKLESLNAGVSASIVMYTIKYNLKKGEK